MWARETLCCPPQPEQTIVPSIDVPMSRLDDLPSLSNSYGTTTSDDDRLSRRTSQSDDVENSALSKSRGKEAHLTAGVLEKIVTNIQEQTKLEPLDPVTEAAVIAKMSPEIRAKEQRGIDQRAQPLQRLHSPVSDRSEPSMKRSQLSCQPAPSTAATSLSTASMNHKTSDAGSSSDGMIRSGSIVHGFTPVSSFRSRPSAQCAPPSIVKTGAQDIQTQKKTGFMLGASSEEDSSFDQHMSYRKTMLEPRKSSLSQSWSKQQVVPAKKTSFKEIVEQHQLEGGHSDEDDNAIASDDEDDDDEFIDESQESDWEDDQEEEQALESAFRRVDSSRTLTSRPSGLTLALQNPSAGNRLAAVHSTPALRRLNRSGSSNAPAAVVATSPEQGEVESLMMAPSGARPMPIVSPPSHPYAMAHSPRTTRLHMLSTELTESLRKNLIWERRQKNTTVNAFLQRQAKSMANLQRAGHRSLPSAAQPAPPPLRPAEQHSTSARTTLLADDDNDYLNVVDRHNQAGW